MDLDLTELSRSIDGNASFRDPDGCLLEHDGRILRLVQPSAIPTLDAFLNTRTAKAFLDRGQLVSTTRVDFAPGDTVVVEHERIPFPSYPYEWPAEMLHAAAGLTLELSESLLGEGFWLKDATPYNVLFRGPTPVFVDMLSFERRDPLLQTWLAYAQFTRAFLLPLLASTRLGKDFRDLLLTRRDGLEPQEVYRWTKPLQRLGRGFFSLVTLPAWLDKRGGSGTYQTKPAGSPEQAEFVLRSLYRGLGGTLRRLQPRASKSTWTDYLECKSLYSSEQRAAKERFVQEAIDEFRPSAALDVGCNEGHFTAMCARSGARVVAIDADPAVVGSVWRRARAEELDILPLVVDLARPTPAVGWRNREGRSFLDRARGSFDLVMMLAVVHHLAVTERAPLEEIVELSSELTTDLAVMEYVGPEDPMFRQLVRGRDLLYRHLTVDYFERAVAPRFEVGSPGTELEFAL